MLSEKLPADHGAEKHSFSSESWRYEVRRFGRYKWTYCIFVIISNRHAFTEDNIRCVLVPSICNMHNRLNKSIICESGKIPHFHVGNDSRRFLGYEVVQYTSNNKQHLSLHLQQHTPSILRPPTTNTIYPYPSNKHHLSLHIQQHTPSILRPPTTNTI